MKPDPLFIAAGTVVLGLVGYLALSILRSKQYHRGPGVLLWTLLGAGLLVQGFAPHLQVRHNAFVVPPALLASHSGLSPAELVARERRMQLLASLLTTGAAFGLAVYYRGLFVRMRSPPEQGVGYRVSGVGEKPVKLS